MPETPFNPESLAYVEQPKKKRFRLPLPSKKSIVILSIFVVGIAIGAGGIFGYLHFKKTSAPVAEQLPDNQPPQAVLGLIETVEKKIPNIPKNEIPSVATIKDLSELSDQEFLEGAKVGDRLMIYSAAKFAILYRPSTNEVVRQGPVEIIGESSEEDTASSSSAVLSASDSAVPALRIKY